MLWLNTCLTVQAHKAHSHSKQGWETFTTAVLKAVTTRSITTEEGGTRKGVVFLAWGAPALKICQSIGVNSVSVHSAFLRHRFVDLELLPSVQEEPPVEVIFILVGCQLWLTLFTRSAHPSPLSASKGFLGNGHFKAANEWLEEEYGDDGPIDWRVLKS